MITIKIKNNRGRAVLFGLSGLSSSLSYFFIFGIDSVLDLFFVTMGCVLVLYSSWILIDRRPQLVLDGRGISGVRSKGDLIPWSEIRSLERRSFGGFEYFDLEHGSGEGSKTGKIRIRADNLDLPPLAIEKIIQHKAGLPEMEKEPG